MRERAAGPARVLLASPTLADIEAATDLMRPYAPEAIIASGGMDRAAFQACARALGVEMRQFDGGSAQATLDHVAGSAMGSTIALLVMAEALPRIVTYALGVSEEAGARFEFSSNAISVLECDADGRWAVVRVNEGAWPPAGH